MLQGASHVFLNLLAKACQQQSWQKMSAVQELGHRVCTNSIDVVALGQYEKTVFTMNVKLAGKIGHQMEQSLRNQMGTNDTFS